MKTGFSTVKPVFNPQLAAGNFDITNEAKIMTETSRNNVDQHELHISKTTEIRYPAVSSHKSATQRKLLVITDETEWKNRHMWSFDDFEPLFANDRDTALAQLSKHHPAVVILDSGLNPHDAETPTGLEILESILDLAPGTKVIVITASGDRENAAKAIGLGAFDYQHKPVDRIFLEFIIEHAFDRYDLDRERKTLQVNDSKARPLHGIIQTSCPEMQFVCRVVDKVAPTSATTLLLGESGTGKELLARALHRQSPRKKAPFVAINCAAIPETLLESELFGYEKGSFTGATSRVLGKIEHADKGTLFLDEIGDLPLPLQAKLLRFLQERTIQRVGGRDEIPVDTRIVCATHHDLAELIDNRLFREDLYYRISEISIKVPALRDRPGDALLLARVFLQEASHKNGKSFRGFSDQALNAIDSYHWPGNVRELRNCVNRAVIMGDGKRIQASDLAIPAEQHAMPLLNLRQVRDTSERETLLKALSMTNGNMSRAAELLGTSRTTIYELAAKHGLK